MYINILDRIPIWPAPFQKKTLFLRKRSLLSNNFLFLTKPLIFRKNMIFFEKYKNIVFFGGG